MRRSRRLLAGEETPAKSRQVGSRIRRKESVASDSLEWSCRLPFQPDPSGQFVNSVDDRRLVLEYIADVVQARDRAGIVDEECEGELPAALRINVAGQVLGLERPIGDRGAGLRDRTAPGR